MPATPSEEDVANFVRDTFVSVWALELLLFLKREPDRLWRRPDLVTALRASESAIDRSIENLFAAGLLVVDEEGSARYGPATAELAGLIGAAEALYRQKPDAVRRLIILPRHDGLSAFADAFRLRKD